MTGGPDPVRGAEPQEALRRAVRTDLSGSAVDVAPRLLGGELRTFISTATEADPVEVRLRITEVEAYHGQGTGRSPTPARTPAWDGRRAIRPCGVSRGVSTCT